MDTAGAVSVVTALRDAMPTLRVCLGGQGATREDAIKGTTPVEASKWLAETLLSA